MEHASAASCVDSGSGVWSESERTLKSDVKSHTKGSSAYPKTVVGLLLGKGGECFQKLKHEVGATMLNLRGDGLGNSSDHAQASSRVHFVCKGAARPDLMEALERRMAEVHTEMRDIIDRGPEARERSRSPRRNSSRHEGKGTAHGTWHQPASAQWPMPGAPPGVWDPRWFGHGGPPPPPPPPPPSASPSSYDGREGRRRHSRGGDR